MLTPNVSRLSKSKINPFRCLRRRNGITCKVAMCSISNNKIMQVNPHSTSSYYRQHNDKKEYYGKDN